MANYQCWHCGDYFDEIFQCKKCNHSYCNDHKEPLNHNCIGIIDVGEVFSTQNLLNISSESGYQPLSPVPDFYLPKNGKIELDRNEIMESINNLLQYYLSSDSISDKTVKKGIRKLVKSNPNGENLIKQMEKVNKDHFIEGLFAWLVDLGNPSQNPLDGLKLLSKNKEIPLKKISLRNLIEFYYLDLNDASYLGNISGYSINSTGRPIKETIEVITHGTIAMSAKILTQISEDARQSGERESTGFLIGNRDLGMSIIDINRYEPIMLGGEVITSLDARSLIQVMKSLENSQEKIVGFAHSHPYKGVPCYSSQDKKTHVKVTIALSLFEHLSSLYPSMPYEARVNVSVYFSQFNLIQIIFLLGAFNSVFNSPNILKKILKIIFQQNPDTWTILEKEINEILYNNNIKPNQIFLNLIPQSGMVICPWKRQIGIIDCIYEDNPQDPDLPVKEWFYYKIAIKKE